MARLVCACALGVMIGVVAGAAKQSHGQEIDGALACQRPEADQPAVCGDPKAIAEATALHEQVPELAISDLVGAANSVGVSPIKYALSTGEIAAPSDQSSARSSAAAGSGVAGVPVASGWPIGGALGTRLYCVEGIESSHGRFMYNSTPVAPWSSEHAAGWLGFLPSTARRWGAAIGNRSSEWAAAARMIQAGAGAQFAGIAAGRC